jgi:hypothetical protein
MTEFNKQLAIDFKEQGIRQIAQNNQHFCKVARNVAASLIRRNGKVTSDDVRRNCPLEPLHPNAWGAVFRDKQFKWTGEFVTSKAVSRRAGVQRVWTFA